METECIDKVATLLREENNLKPSMMKRVLELAAILKIKNEEFLASVEQTLIYTVEYDTFRDFLEIMDRIIDNNDLSPLFWKRMMEKVITWKEHWTVKDSIELLKMFSGQRRAELGNFIAEHSKVYIAQDV